MALVTRLEQAQLGCADESCMTDIGALAEADFLVASSVTPAGDGRLLTVELLGRPLWEASDERLSPGKGIQRTCSSVLLELLDWSMLTRQSYGAIRHGDW